MRVMVVRLEGLHCGSCLNTIERVSKELGAIKVDIELSTMIGKLYYDNMDEDEVVNEIERYGYKANKLATYDEREL